MNTDILEGNKLIAEFMGWKTHSKYGGGYLENNDKHRVLPPVYTDINNEGFLNDFKYHSSWDWLMPVIKKCWNIINTFDYDSEEYFHLTEEIFHIDYSLNEFMSADIESVYERVVEFIKWYNKNYLNE